MRLFIRYMIAFPKKFLSFTEQIIGFKWGGGNVDMLTIKHSGQNTFDKREVCEQRIHDALIFEIQMNISKTNINFHIQIYRLYRYKKIYLQLKDILLIIMLLKKEILR